MMFATISADIVSSTSLSGNTLIELHDGTQKVLCAIEERYPGFWGRVVKGDSVECVMDNPEDALEIALLLKTWIKSFVPNNGIEHLRFRRYGLRMAIGLGELRTNDRERGIIDGEAIYRSGRALDKNLVGRAKYSFTISMADVNLERDFKVIFSLLNNVINNASARQCETLFHRMMSNDSKSAAEKMGISISGINQTLNTVGWNSIEQALEYYRMTISSLNG